jgi:hypothetical protein
LVHDSDLLGLPLIQVVWAPRLLGVAVTRRSLLLVVSQGHASVLRSGLDKRRNLLWLRIYRSGWGHRERDVSDFDFGSAVVGERCFGRGGHSGRFGNLKLVGAF